MTGRSSGLDAQEVPARHPQHEPVDVDVALPRQQVPEPADALGERGRQLSPHVPARQHPLHLEDQLADQRPAPRRPGGGARRCRVGLRQQVEGGQPLGCLHARGDVHDEVLVGEVPPGRRVGKDQVIGHHRRRELRVIGLEPHRRQLRRGDLDAERNVVAAPDLADVVQERAHEQRLGSANLGHRLALQRVLRVRRREQLGHGGGGREEVDVDREPVVRVALGPAPDARPARQVADQQPHAVQQVQHARPLRARPEQPVERVAHAVVPRHRVGHVGVCHGVHEVRRGDRVALGDRRERAQHARRPVPPAQRADAEGVRRRSIARSTASSRSLACSNSVRMSASWATRSGASVKPEAGGDLGLQLAHQPVAAAPRRQVHGAARPDEELLGVVHGRRLAR